MRYNTLGSSDALTAVARYNGNISEMRRDAGTPKGYGFVCDGLNRLTGADYSEGRSFTGNADYYNTSYAYDKNGNIELLNRYRGIKIDGLDYAYGSNEKSTNCFQLQMGQQRQVIVPQEATTCTMRTGTLPRTPQKAPPSNTIP